MRRIYRKANPFDSYMFHDLKKRIGLQLKPHIDFGRWNLDEKDSNGKRVLKLMNFTGPNNRRRSTSAMKEEYEYLYYML
jgi:hypothetical protein